ncbi:glucosamine--fructose-6-phosphate aminotransferase [Gottschalkia acidurici 9a]|uniref:Glutamine--fructose-6-phosphate aminotransferase [isomerizing] n=1 Tax=Gottschalkia acidurici (strain ATCC 7906 / DSM 604 / BCRC 14475 / CIP 104303 / KCTC 5404 / NCIMB 10678 / 9a) TaxID=1128398 RepID=K0B244_GOTA9|nr:glutamine--fructose-6-phosphate transaminase (isomerizing) [Gottschalkia acidurici]AFS79187.1 glucosamine--fructose-6-phosphate aminotransferase [Gottschalkia acidurici 9a]
MCGIVGYIGNKEASGILIEGLSKLEYRGYDSAGVAIINESGITISKTKGRLSNLEKKLRENPIQGKSGIGHTRWATHGEPSDTNSHPHFNKDQSISVVHNGIIENYMYLKEWLISIGYEFKSETDTEVIAHLVDYYYKGNIVEAVSKAVEKLEGSYALGVITSNEPEKLVAIRKDSPLIVGLGKGENFIASDIPAILNHTRDIFLLEDKELVILTKENVEIMTLEGMKVEKELFHVTWNAESAEKGGYEHFMIKEIHEQPKAIKDTLTSRIMSNSDEIKLDDISITKEDIQNIDKIFIVACGTAYHAGMVGKYVIEKLARIPVEVDIASEFRYRDPIINEKALMIVISQSGETADTLAALIEAKKQGARVIAVTNVVGSSAAREADDILYTWAGPEIAVASTKAYTTQLVAMYVIALYLAKLNENISIKEYREIRDELLKLPEKVEKLLEEKEELQKFANNNHMHRDMFYLGRGLDNAVALEGALKLKEISYIHAESYAAGELKHGPIALIDKDIPVIALATQDELFEKMVSNIKEVVTRGARVIAIAFEGNEDIEKVAEQVVYIPKTMSLLSPILSVVPLQLLSYYVSVTRGCDVDKPRNLAKSVTVE